LLGLLVGCIVDDDHLLALQGMDDGDVGAILKLRVDPPGGELDVVGARHYEIIEQGLVMPVGLTVIEADDVLTLRRIPGPFRGVGRTGDDAHSPVIGMQDVYLLMGRRPPRHVALEAAGRHHVAHRAVAGRQDLVAHQFLEGDGLLDLAIEHLLVAEDDLAGPELADELGHEAIAR